MKDSRIGGDFAVFYAEAQVAAKYPHSDLYNTELQDREYSALIGPQTSSPFAYAPWFSLPVYLLARLPYGTAFATWSALSLIALWAAYTLLARVTNVPVDWYAVGLLACIAFPPYLFYSLLNGQPTAFGLLVLSATFVLQHRGTRVASGIVLSLLTYKPTLLVFLLLMLVFIREWRVLSGLIIGVGILSIVSLAWAGVSGCIGFLKLLLLYSQVLSSPLEVFQTEKYVDIGSAIRLLLGPQPLIRIVITAIALPVVSFIWYRRGNRSSSWSLAIIAGLLLGAYSPIYDCTMLIFAVLLFGVTRVARSLLCALYLMPAFTVWVASVTRIQVYTILLIAVLSLFAYGAFPGKTSANYRLHG